MFNVRLAIQELGIERKEIDEIKSSPRAKDAKGANPSLKVSSISTVSMAHVPENRVSSSQEKAERLIDSIQFRDDRVFVRQQLIGAYGSDRLAMVQEYLRHWQVGSNSEPAPHKKDNVGRYRANTWLREKLEHEKP